MLHCNCWITGHPAVPVVASLQHRDTAGGQGPSGAFRRPEAGPSRAWPLPRISLASRPSAEAVFLLTLLWPDQTAAPSHGGGSQ